MRIAVYCSSSPLIDQKFIDLSFELGEAIAASGADLVSGGGHISSMGAISRGARSKGESFHRSWSILNLQITIAMSL
jgi:predicted Rossmann-fold nucleotide-binding protein